MKRDNDLIRELLLRIEDDPQFDGTREWMQYEASDLGITDHSNEEVAYHLNLLVEEGFVTGRTTTDMPIISKLTWQGHEFLDTVRDGEIWKLTKESAKKAGATSVQVLFEIGKSYARQKLIEHGVHLG
jgi:hypothetical protein